MKKSLVTVLLLTGTLLMTSCGAKDTSDSVSNAETQPSEEQSVDAVPPETAESSQAEAVDTEYENMLEQFDNCKVIFLEKSAFSGEELNLNVDVDIYSFVIDFEKPSDFIDQKELMDWIKLTGKENTVATKCDLYTIGEGDDAFYWGYLYLPQGTEPGDNIELVYYNFRKDEEIRKDVAVSLGEYDFSTNNALICKNDKYFVYSQTTGISTGGSSVEQSTTVQYRIACLNDINYKLENTDDFVIRYDDELDEELLDYAYSNIQIVNGAYFNFFYVQIECGASYSQSGTKADEAESDFLYDAAKKIWNNAVIEFKGVQIN